MPGKITRPWAAWLTAFAALFGAAAMGACDRAAAQEFEMTEAQFDQWLTGGRGDPIKFMESQLGGQLARLDETCHLTDRQREKLELAGRGDIARFQKEVEKLEFELVGKKMPQQEIGEAYQQIQPLAMRMREGILGEGSLFNKVLYRTLDGPQQALMRRLEEERVNFQYLARLKLVIVSLDKSAPMLHEQRQALLKLLARTTRPPRRWRGDQYDWMYVMHQAGRVPRDELSRILDAAQMRAFEQAMARGAGFGQALERQGMVPRDDEASPAADSPRDRQNKLELIPEIQIGGS
jgi:hypothetical protein